MEFRILGPLEVVGPDGPAVVRGAKRRGLLAHLLVHAGQVVSTDRLVDDLWGQRPSSGARGTVQSYLSGFRKLLADGDGVALETHPSGYVLTVPADALDTARFERLCERVASEVDAAKRLEWVEAALRLWRGPPLGEFAGSAWADVEATRLEALRLHALQQAVDARLALGRHAEAIPELERLVGEHPLDERFWAQLMVSYYRAGRQADALRAYGRARSILADELGIEPGAELAELERQVLDHDPGLVSQVRCEGELRSPALRTSEVVPNNLPAQLSSFVGREREMARVGELLAGHRLVTLTGVGGTGKTRLALEYAAETLERFPDGVHLVELATVADPSLVAERVAAAVSVQPSARSGHSEVEHLAACLGGQRMLLVLDNCEHVIDATATLAEGLLQGCANVSVLATSREALGVAGEQALRVPSLSMPEHGRLDAGELHACESARLFVERARSADPDFSVADAEAEAVGEICRRLDGIPLAIELAAARVASLSLTELAERLDDQFRLLVGGRRTVVERHQTLRAAIDWSYDLLGDDARVLLPRLGVFSGGWSLAAAETVCADEPLESVSVLDALSDLVDKSIVVREPGEAGSRYRMVEPLRQYALERLAAAGETETLRDRHAAWIEERLALSSYQEAAVRNNDLEAVLLGIAEYPNVVEAIRWLLERGDADAAARLLAGTWPAVFATGRYREAREFTDAALSRDDLCCWTRYLTQIISAHYIWWFDDAHDAQDAGSRVRSRVQEAVAVGEACAEVTSPYQTYMVLGLMAHRDGGLGDLTDQLQAASAEAAAEGDQYYAQYAVFWLGLAAIQDGDYERGIQLLREAYEPLEGIPVGFVPYAPVFIAHAKVLAGRDDVEAAIEEAEAVARAAGDPTAINWALCARAAGPPERARAALDEGFRLINRHGDPWPFLEAAALYAQRQDDPAGTARALGALSTVVETITAHAHWKRWSVWARERLGEDVFAQEYQIGVRAGAEAVIKAMLDTHSRASTPHEQTSMPPRN